MQFQNSRTQVVLTGNNNGGMTICQVKTIKEDTNLLVWRTSLPECLAHSVKERFSIPIVFLELDLLLSDMNNDTTLVECHQLDVASLPSPHPLLIKTD